MVVGGTSGIGLEIVRSCIREGASVIVVGRHQPMDIFNGTQSSNVVFHKWNLSDFSKYSKHFKQCVSFFGRIDTLINCAGVCGDNGKKKFGQITENDLHITHDINVLSLQKLMEEFCCLPNNGTTPKVIINILSMVAFYPAFDNYQVSKWAARKLTQIYAERYKNKGVKICGVAPGIVKTPMSWKTGHTVIVDNPLQRMAIPEEIAELVIMFATGCFQSGKIYLCDGGYCQIFNP